MDDKDYHSLRAEMGLDGLKDDICDMFRAGEFEGLSDKAYRILAEMVGFEEEES